MKHLITDLALWFAKALLGLAFAVGGAMLLAEFMSGCGDTYIDSQGHRHKNECMFIK